jgi:hypothetical protein
MKPTPHEDVEREDRRGSKPPLFVKVADEGNIPGRPKPVAMAIIVAVLIVGLGALYLAG